MAEAGGTLERIQPVTEEQAKVYTFQEWIRESLAEVDPDVVVQKDGLGRLQVKLHGDWHIATIYGPPVDLLPALLDVYPRELQTEMFRRIIFGINSWCRLVTDPHTGATVPK